MIPQSHYIHWINLFCWGIGLWAALCASNVHRTDIPVQPEVEKITDTAYTTIHPLINPMGYPWTLTVLIKIGELCTLSSFIIIIIYGQYYVMNVWAQCNITSNGKDSDNSLTIESHISKPVPFEYCEKKDILHYKSAIQFRKENLLQGRFLSQQIFNCFFMLQPISGAMIYNLIQSKYNCKTIFQQATSMLLTCQAASRISDKRVFNDKLPNHFYNKEEKHKERHKIGHIKHSKRINFTSRVCYISNKFATDQDTKWYNESECTNYPDVKDVNIHLHLPKYNTVCTNGERKTDCTLPYINTRSGMISSSPAFKNFLLMYNWK